MFKKLNAIEVDDITFLFEVEYNKHTVNGIKDVKFTIKHFYNLASGSDVKIKVLSAVTILDAICYFNNLCLQFDLSGMGLSALIDYTYELYKAKA